MKKTEYIITYENGSQKTFSSVYQIQLCCEVPYTDIKKALKTGEAILDKVVNQKIWIEEMV